jgi:hypothetical protein
MVSRKCSRRGWIRVGKLVALALLGGTMLWAAVPTGTSSAASALCAEYAQPVQFPEPEFVFDWSAALNGEEFTMELNGGTATTAEVWGLNRWGTPEVVANPSTLVFRRMPTPFTRVRISGQDGTVTVRVSCNSDGDRDGTDADVDNCWEWANPDQADLDGDGYGDGRGDNCDPDMDGDGQTNSAESACGSDPRDPLSLSADLDLDQLPDCVDPDVVALSTPTDPALAAPSATEPATAAAPTSNAAPTATPGPALADTGRPGWSLALVGLAVTAAGATLTAVSRRRGPQARERT